MRYFDQSNFLFLHCMNSFIHQNTRPQLSLVRTITADSENTVGNITKDSTVITDNKQYIVQPYGEQGIFAQG